MMLRIVLFLLSAVSLTFAAAPEGIPRELARQRAAEISNLRYHVSFTLTPKADTTVGHEELRFVLKTATPVLLDYRDGEISAAKLDGTAIPVQTENGRLVLPAEHLHLGENMVILDFTSHVAPAASR